MLNIKIDGDEKTLEEQDTERVITNAELTDCKNTVSLPLVDGYMLGPNDLVIKECPLCGAAHFHIGHDYHEGDIIIASTNCDHTREFVRKYECYAVKIVGKASFKEFRKFEARKPNKKRVKAGHLPRFYVDMD